MPLVIDHRFPILLTLLLFDHDLENDDDEHINVAYISRLLSGDWGFYYTVKTNLGKVREFVPQCAFLNDTEREIIDSRIERLMKAIEECPKTGRWTLRSRIGTRRQWYKEVEEKVRG